MLERASSSYSSTPPISTIFHGRQCHFQLHLDWLKTIPASYPRPDTASIRLYPLERLLKLSLRQSISYQRRAHIQRLIYLQENRFQMVRINKEAQKIYWHLSFKTPTFRHSHRHNKTQSAISSWQLCRQWIGSS